MLQNTICDIQDESIQNIRSERGRRVLQLRDSRRFRVVNFNL